MERKKILFVLNPLSGPKDTDFKQEIDKHFKQLTNFEISYLKPDWSRNPAEEFKTELSNNSYDIVVASGGDGTVRFVAQNLYGTNISMGILPTGSANGLAKNLHLDENIFNALKTIENGKTMPVSSLTVNGKFCIHIADIGLNASIVRRFEKQKRRGFFGYLKAFTSVAFKQKMVKANILADGKEYVSKFYMLVFSNGTGYGTGLPINPGGRLDDDQFEIVQVEKFSIAEAIRLYLGKDKPSPDIVSILSCKQVQVKTKKPVHLQVDGEYFGKVKNINVDFNDKFIEMIVPEAFLKMKK